MPVYTIQSPDGRKIKIEAADEATAIRGAKEYAASTSRAAPPNDKGIGRKVDAAVRGAADFLSFGLADEAQAGLEAIPALAKGGAAYGKAYRDRLKGQQDRDAADKRDVPVSRGVGQTVGFGAGLALGGVVNAGRAVPRLAPNGGRVVRAVETTARNALTGGAYGALSGAGGSDPGLENRLKGGFDGAKMGAAVGAIAAPVAAVGGRVIQGVGNAMAPTGRRALNRFANASGRDVAAMRAEAAQYRAAGINPTLTDVTDEAGRGAIRAGASRMTPGRQVAQDFAGTRALDLPDRIGAQARQNMSRDPRTPDQIREAMATQRGANADRAFGAVRGDTIPLGENTVTALRSDYGRAAITEAARRESNPQVRAALNRLANDALDNPGQTQITIGMADRISRVLNGQAQAEARRGDVDLQRILSGFAEDVRGPARTASPGYADALEGFGADSRLMQAADVGENLMTRNSDEFVQQASALSDPERELALAAGRRAVERASGESVAAAPGVARRLSTAPEQMARNRALMGPERAGRFEQGVRMEERAVQNARQIEPRFGSQTQNKAQDAGELAGMAQTGIRALRGDVGGIAMDWLRSRGMSNQEAEALVRMSTDPASLDQALRILERRVGTQGAQEFLQAVTRQAGARNLGEGSAARVQPRP